MISIKLRKRPVRNRGNNKNKPKVDPLTVKLTCQLCRKTFKTARLYPDKHPVIKANGFTNHLNARPKCKKFYDQNFKNGGELDVYPSLEEDRRVVKDFLSLHQCIPFNFSPSHFGLTRTPNGPIDPIDSLERTSNRPRRPTDLNDQTIYHANQPTISRENIAAALNRSRSEHDDFDAVDDTTKDIPACGSEADDDFDEIPVCGSEDDDHDFDEIPARGSEDDNNLHAMDDTATDLVTEGISNGRTAGGDNDSEDTTATDGINDEATAFGDVANDTRMDMVTDDDFGIDTVPTPIPIKRMNPLLSSEVELLTICTQLKMPLKGFKIIWDWATKCQEKDTFDFASRSTCRTRETVLKDVRELVGVTEKDEYVKKTINWRPDNLAVDLHIRPFKKALFSLLTEPGLVVEENLSLPDSRSPYSCENHPPVDVISELHHGSWWADSWKKRCDASKKEILVPLIFYMDGISLDSSGRLTLTPLNMTLGIFNTATRRRPEAWVQVYSHPDVSYLASNQTKKPTAEDNIRNLQTGLEQALASLMSEMDKGGKGGGIVWNELPWNKKKYQVKMKFAIAFVIGDTELHDKLCCRYAARQGDLVKICRHCDCPTKVLSNPTEQAKTTLWKPEHFSLNNSHGQRRPSEYWKEVSHHPVKNVFHHSCLDFGENPYKIHLATPGECLHMHQLGVAKRSIEAFVEFLKKQQTHRQGNRVQAKNLLSRLGSDYGGFLSRQSDRDFPRTRFTSCLLSCAKKEGKDYSGMILCLVLSCLSDYGQKLLKEKALVEHDKQVHAQIETLELIVMMEEFLKNFGLQKTKLCQFEKMISHFLGLINANCQREGMGTNLIKNHLYFHLPRYIELWGPPTGWDSSFSESHHKTEVKAPSKNTQKNARTLIEQTARRQAELNLLRRARHGLEKGFNPQPRPKLSSSGGAQFTIFKQLEENGEYTNVMEYKETCNKDKPVHPQAVIDYCCKQFLHPGVDVLHGFTEHNRGDQEERYKFRAHPSYRCNSGQSSGVWYDWAEFAYDDGNPEPAHAPAQIMCFLRLGPENTPKNNTPEDSPAGLLEKGEYAVVRSFQDPIQPLKPSKIVFKGKLDKNFYFYSCESISAPVTVVPHVISGPGDGNDNGSRGGNVLHSTEFFVVKNRQYWLELFHEVMEKVAKEVPTLPDSS